MKHKTHAILAGLLVLPMAGCVINVSDDSDERGADWRERQEYNRNVISGLEIGQTRESVESLLGRPDFTEAYLHDGARYHILHYRTQHQRSDGKTTPDETTPLIFRDGHLEGWGETLYTKVTRGSDR